MDEITVKEKKTQDMPLPPLSITDEAYKHLLRIKQQESIPLEHGLRVGVNGGGCSGISYVLGFDEKKEGDQQFLFRDMPVYMNKAHGLHLLGMTIDWKDDEEQKGFLFRSEK